MDKTRKKLSRPAKFAILTGCLLLAVGGYALAVKISSNAEEAENAETISFVSMSSDEVSKLTWSYGDKEYTLEKGEDGSWVWTDDKDFALEQDTVNEMAYAISNIAASRELTGVTDYSQYGLDEPDSKISFETADGETVEILTGDLNEVSGEYYARRSDDYSVYLVTGEYLDYFECSADELAAADDEDGAYADSEEAEDAAAESSEDTGTEAEAADAAE